ncbi:hypothetical protein M917_1644 [Psychrobacter aquaticus CMS 56]|uniref:Uncharacterized protein n=1 Tax=Psychrobacter aquaticus CMS 56 TaxID=1354303 RepID=U4T2U5_9GAMM|nr:hypothetical protein M917_1644 [Psychrobacter aquaticus CMS 56]
MSFETALTPLQINQVTKHPAIFCHDVCVIGWLKKKLLSDLSTMLKPKR